MQMKRITAALLAVSCGLVFLVFSACASRSAVGPRSAGKAVAATKKPPTPQAKAAAQGSAAGTAMSCLKRYPVKGFTDKLKILYGTDKREAQRTVYWFRRQFRRGLRAVPTLHCMHREVPPQMQVYTFKALAYTTQHQATPQLLALLTKELGSTARANRTTALYSLRIVKRGLAPHLSRVLRQHRSLATAPRTSEYYMQFNALILARDCRGLAGSLPNIIHLSKHPNVHIKLGASRAMGALTPLASEADARAAVARLVELLSHSHQAVVNAAIRALGAAGPRASGAIPALMTLYAQQTRKYGYSIPPALGKIKTQAAVTALLKILSRKNRHRSITITSLGKMGPIARRAVTPLRKLKRAKATPIARNRIDIALYRIQPQRLDALGTKLKGNDSQERNRAFRLLGRLAPYSHRLLPTLGDLLKQSPEPRLRARIARHLGLYCQRGGSLRKPYCTQAIDLLLYAAQRDSAAQVRSNALQRLRYIKLSIKDKVPQLYQALKQEKARSNRTALLHIIAREHIAYPPFQRMLKQMATSSDKREQRMAKWLLNRYAD